MIEIGIDHKNNVVTNVRPLSRLISYGACAVTCREGVREKVGLEYVTATSKSAIRMARERMLPVAQLPPPRRPLVAERNRWQIVVVLVPMVRRGVTARAGGREANEGKEGRITPRHLVYQVLKHPKGAGIVET